MKRIIASLLVAVSIMTLLATAAFAAVSAEIPEGQTSPCTGGPLVITPDYFENNYAIDLDYGSKSYIQTFRMTWHTYAFEVMQDDTSDLMISKLTFPKKATRGLVDLDFYYHSQSIADDGDLYYPTADLTKTPYFAVKYRMNETAYEYAKDLQSHVGFYRESYAISGNNWNHAQYFDNSVAAADEWTIDVLDLTSWAQFGQTPATIVDLYKIEYRPFGLDKKGEDGSTDTIPEGAEIDFAWMGFFATEDEAKAFEGLKASDLPTKPETTLPDTTTPADTTNPDTTKPADTSKPAESVSASDTAPAATESGSNVGLYVAIGAIAVVVIAVIAVVAVKKKKK